MAFCNSCGANIGPENKFCTKCGAAVVGEVPLASAPGSSRLIYRAEGIGDVLELYEHKITIKRKGLMNFLSKGLQGDKDIFLNQLTSVQFKKAGAFVSGYLRFGVLGGIEGRGGVTSAAADENAVMFNAQQEPTFDKIRAALEMKLGQRAVGNSVGSFDDLEKLAGLRDRGIITQEEFATKKKQLLNI